MTKKLFINADDLLTDAFTLGEQILASGYQPDLIIGLWRGGSPVAIAIHELFVWAGMAVDHIPVRTQLYRGIEQRADEVAITGLDYLSKPENLCQRLLVVDDVFDTGLTMTAVTTKLLALYENRPGPEIRTATTWYKPTRNQTVRRPDYFLHTTAAWLVFPHELVGLSEQELCTHKPAINRIFRNK